MFFTFFNFPSFAMNVVTFSKLKLLIKFKAENKSIYYLKTLFFRKKYKLLKHSLQACFYKKVYFFMISFWIIKKMIQYLYQNNNNLFFKSHIFFLIGFRHSTFNSFQFFSFLNIKLEFHKNYEGLRGQGQNYKYNFDLGIY